jgi:acylphosphatase
MIVRARITVGGRVQGVAFRAHTERTARALGLAGFVRNLADGGVEIEAEGEAAAVNALAAWAKQGPPSARVAGQKIEILAASGGDTGFIIKY